MATLLASDDGAGITGQVISRRRRLPPLSVRRKLRRQWHPNARTSHRRCSTSSGSSCDSATSFPITDSDIRRWAIAVYYPEPAPRLFWDAEYAAGTVHGGIVAPEDFNPFAWLTQTEADAGVVARADGRLRRSARRSWASPTPATSRSSTAAPRSSTACGCGPVT